MEPTELVQIARDGGWAAVIASVALVIHRALTVFGPAAAERLKVRAARRLNGSLVAVVEEVVHKLSQDWPASFQDRVDARVTTGLRDVAQRMSELHQWRQEHEAKTETGFTRLHHVEGEVAHVKETLLRLEKEAQDQRAEILRAIEALAERLERGFGGEILRLRDRSHDLAGAVQALQSRLERDREH